MFDQKHYLHKEASVLIFVGLLFLKMKKPHTHSNRSSFSYYLCKLFKRWFSYMIYVLMLTLTFHRIVLLSLIFSKKNVMMTVKNNSFLIAPQMHAHNAINLQHVFVTNPSWYFQKRRIHHTHILYLLGGILCMHKYAGIHKVAREWIRKWVGMRPSIYSVFFFPSITFDAYSFLSSQSYTGCQKVFKATNNTSRYNSRQIKSTGET